MSRISLRWNRWTKNFRFSPCGVGFGIAFRVWDDGKGDAHAFSIWPMMKSSSPLTLGHQFQWVSCILSASGRPLRKLFLLMSLCIRDLWGFQLRINSEGFNIYLREGEELSDDEERLRAQINDWSPSPLGGWSTSRLWLKSDRSFRVESLNMIELWQLELFHRVLECEKARFGYLGPPGQ